MLQPFCCINNRSNVDISFLEGPKLFPCIHTNLFIFKKSVYNCQMLFVVKFYSLSSLSFCSFSLDYPSLLSLVLLYNLPFKPSTILSSCYDLIFLLIFLCGHTSHPILWPGILIWTIYYNNDKLYIAFLYNHLQDSFVYFFRRYYIFLPFAPYCNLDSSVCSLVFPIFPNTAPYVYKFTL